LGVLGREGVGEEESEGGAGGALVGALVGASVVIGIQSVGGAMDPAMDEAGWVDELLELLAELLDIGIDI